MIRLIQQHQLQQLQLLLRHHQLIQKLKNLKDKVKVLLIQLYLKKQILLKVHQMQMLKATVHQLQPKQIQIQLASI